MQKEQFSCGGKVVTVYPAKEAGKPLIVMHTYSGDGHAETVQARRLSGRDFSLVCVGNLSWDHDMTPWYCPPLSDQDTPCTGGADEYLKVLCESVLPEALGRLQTKPACIAIAGYSLAGLFALYALYRTAGIFAGAACMSGSFWFPGFLEYALNHELKTSPVRLYFSLGDREAAARHPLLKTVRKNTEALTEYYRSQGIDVRWELNPGNHFRDIGLRTAKGLAALVAPDGSGQRQTAESAGTD